MKLERTTALAVAGASALALSTTGTARPWQQPNGSLAGERAAASSPINARTVSRLRPLWQFDLPPGSPYGSFASTPLVVGDTVYAQDLSSSVYALDASTGRPRWTFRVKAPNDGPNGIAVAGSRVFGATDTAVFALDRRTGKRRWARRLVSRTEQFIDIAPLAARGLVVVSTVGFPPGGRGAVYALDQETGRIRWRFQTIRDPWRFPSAGGGGAWYTPSVAADGTLYVGISNPGPWGGSRVRPNGGMYPGPVPYTDAMVALDADTGKLRWFDQVTKHDVRDYDFSVSPIVVGKTVFGAGKAGRVVAWDRRSGRRLWSTAVGTHLHDLGPLPSRPVVVCPGLWGGVLTPMAYASGRLFVPVVERCAKEGAAEPANLPDLRRGDGALSALDAHTGRKLWSRRLGSPATGCATVAGDVVFVPTLDGDIFALATKDGAVLWQDRETAGINSCPSISGGLLIVGAGAPRRSGASPTLTAYELSGRGARGARSASLASPSGLRTTRGFKTTSAVSLCRGSQLHGSFSALRGSAGAGNISYRLVLTNVSQMQCSVTGLPQGRLLGKGGKPLPTHVRAAFPGALSAVLVRLAPGHKAYATARFSPDVPGAGEPVAGRNCEPTSWFFRVAARGGGTTKVKVAPPTPVCEHGQLQFSAYGASA